MTLKKQIFFSVVAGLLLTYASIQVWQPPVPCGAPGSPQPGPGDMPCLGAQTAGWPFQVVIFPPTPFYSWVNRTSFLMDVAFWSVASFALIRIGSIATKRRV